MKLAKKTRKSLYEAEGKAIAIDWPENGPEVRKGHSYAVFSEKGERVFRIEVQAVERKSFPFKARVKIDADPKRPLMRAGIERDEDGRLKPEPEQVSEEYQEWLSMQGSAKTAVQGAEHRFEAKRADKEQRLAQARENGHAKTIKTLERVGRAA